MRMRNWMKSKKKTSETTCTRAIRMVDVVVLLSFLYSFLGCCLVPGVYFSPPISGYLFCFVLTKMCLLRIMNSIESTVLNTYDSNLIHWRKLKILFGHRILIFALNRWSIFYDYCCCCCHYFHSNFIFVKEIRYSVIQGEKFFLWLFICASFCNKYWQAIANLSTFNFNTNMGNCVHKIKYIYRELPISYSSGNINNDFI